MPHADAAGSNSKDRYSQPPPRFSPSSSSSSSAAAAAAASPLVVVEEPEDEDQGLMDDVIEVESHDTTARKKAAQLLADQRSEDEGAVEDPVIAAAATLDKKVELATKRHNKAVVEPELKNLLFNIRYRFPHEGVLLALDNVFNPKRPHWKSGRVAFLHHDFSGDVKALLDHFGQECETGTTAIDVATFETELGSALIYLWDARARVEAAKLLAQPVPNPASQTKWSNPIMSKVSHMAKCLSGEAIDPPPQPIVCPSMHELVMDFINTKECIDNTPNFVLLAQIALTVAVSTASCERGFSLMKRIATRLRSRLGQPMLDALMRIQCLCYMLTDEVIHACVKFWYESKPRRV